MVGDIGGERRMMKEQEERKSGNGRIKEEEEEGEGRKRTTAENEHKDTCSQLMISILYTIHAVPVVAGKVIKKYSHFREERLLNLDIQPLQTLFPGDQTAFLPSFCLSLFLLLPFFRLRTSHQIHC